MCQNRYSKYTIALIYNFVYSQQKFRRGTNSVHNLFYLMRIFDETSTTIKTRTMDRVLEAIPLHRTCKAQLFELTPKNWARAKWFAGSLGIQINKKVLKTDMTIFVPIFSRYFLQIHLFCINQVQSRVSWFNPMSKILAQWRIIQQFTVISVIWIYL